MSGSTSQPSAHRSSSDIRQDIASYVLKHQDELSDVPGVKKFLEHHGRLAEEIVASKKLGKRLAKAREKYEPFEKRVLNCQDALKNAETKLAKLHRPLGESTFKAFISGSIAEQSVYSDRLAVQKRIRELRKERYSLSPSPDAGVVQKTKAKAHQLAIAARVKLEEMKCGRLETEIGRHLVENELDASAQCESTSELWGRIATCRGVVTSCSSDLQQANSARGKASKQLCDAVPLQHIESSKTFDAEIKSCQKHIRDSESSLLATTRSLAEELAAIESSKLPKPLVTKLGELKTTPNKDASELFKEACRRRRESVALGGVGGAVKKCSAQMFSY